ncbi:acetyltransferase [Brachyspira hyodysenteriae]|uniref:GNAT family N-acetyltransferase n=1 Tax=Brachyspira hyodysenteriae ATCC 27164 TaxID=1266923 RepID=A0A3B6VRA9_BRAHO|nr:GNAT family N-acetyltransferase [Brachyspira hyodysenteriae]ANN63526.1 GNAT family N-acetyltransferase [Brachyspira hyodysenteriae ATCC 27164]KLI27902.1 acetyltransferase [Brachyspira hyodysenteriae]MCZ9925379.1 GNAT family N-acetyltransferase [Brachyspira hyodysenteriae]TVL79682.1 acetyltransferase [Brachyspira hyodysenteriae]TVL81187.1 acetyltransferase [Brachyspira hyodysenteriae]
MQIRKTTVNDIDKILEIFDYARKFMAENNNANQWINGYPGKKDVESDIKNDSSYVCLEDNGDIIGTFSFAIGEDENYDKIYNGNWLNDKEYGTIHRIAVMGGRKGVASFCLNYCLNICSNIRIDTHKDNIPMLNFLKKEGFKQCGNIILKLNGGERIAFQKTV